jgi:hypothetical protein
MSTQQKLPVDKRVEQAAYACATSLLTEFPELASIAIVVDWNLPGWAGDSLPSFVWLPAAGVNKLGAMAGMQPQLAKAISMLMRTHLASVMRLAQERPSRETTPECTDPDNSTPRDTTSDGGTSSPPPVEN